MQLYDNGPRAGRGTGRFKRTGVNDASKATPPPPLVGPAAAPPGGAPPPVVPPGSAVQYGAQLGQAESKLFQTLAQLRLERGALQGTFKTAKAGIKAGEIAGVVGAENQAMERGVTGSSSDLEQRSAVSADAAAQLAAAQQAKLQGILGIKGARIQAANDFYSTAFDIQAAKAAEQSQMASDALMRDLVMRLGDESAPPGGSVADLIAKLKALLAGASGGGVVAPGGRGVTYNADTAFTQAREGGGY